MIKLCTRTWRVVDPFQGRWCKLCKIVKHVLCAHLINSMNMYHVETNSWRVRLSIWLAHTQPTINQSLSLTYCKLDRLKDARKKAAFCILQQKLPTVISYAYHTKQRAVKIEEKILSKKRKLLLIDKWWATAHNDNKMQLEMVDFAPLLPYGKLEETYTSFCFWPIHYIMCIM